MGAHWVLYTLGPVEVQIVMGVFPLVVMPTVFPLCMN